MRAALGACALVVVGIVPSLAKPHSERDDDASGRNGPRQSISYFPVTDAKSFITVQVASAGSASPELSAWINQNAPDHPVGTYKIAAVQVRTEHLGLPSDFRELPSSAMQRRLAHPLRFTDFSGHQWLLQNVSTYRVEAGASMLFHVVNELNEKVGSSVFYFYDERSFGRIRIGSEPRIYFESLGNGMCVVFQDLTLPNNSVSKKPHGQYALTEDEFSKLLLLEKEKANAPDIQQTRRLRDQAYLDMVRREQDAARNPEAPE